MPAIPTTRQQRQVMDRIAGFVGTTFMQNRIPLQDGWRMLATILTWMAVEAGLSADEYAQALKAMHEDIKQNGKTPLQG